MGLKKSNSYKKGGKALSKSSSYKKGKGW